MKNLAIVLRVAAWEFRRFFKWHEQFWSILLSVLIGGGVVGVVYMVKGKRSERVVRLGVLHSDRLPGLETALGDRYKLRSLEGSLGDPALQEVLRNNVVHAILSIDSPTSTTILAMKKPSWEADLNRRITQASQSMRLASRGLDGAELSEMLAPAGLKVTYDEKGRPPLAGGESGFITFVVTAMIMAVISGNALLFAGITGEKESRITEQVISAITPQQWIDGKMLGLSWVTFASLLNGVLGLVFVLAVAQLAFGRFTLIPGSIDPWIATVAIACAFLGYYFWCTFFGAVAATIDNPNQSGRSMFMLLPALPLALGYFVKSDPESTFVRVCSLLPISSPAVLPARMVLVDVPLWEIAASMALLVVGIWILRRAAGKIFATGLLMYGKEPSLGEMWRWMREK